MERNRNFDLLKVLCAMMVVCIHTTLPQRIVYLIIPACRVAVPLFFMITGYYYSNTKEHKKEAKQLGKILRLTIGASILYACYSFGSNWIEHGNVHNLLQSLVDVKTFVHFLLLNVAPFGGHLWYLMAVLYVLLFIFLFEKKWSRKFLYPLIPVLLIANLALGSYSQFLLGQPLQHIFTRNFLFTGLPYFLMGDMFFNCKVKIKGNLCLFLALVFAGLSVLEGLVLQKYTGDGLKDHYFSTFFFAVFLFQFALHWNNPHKGKFHGMLCYIGAKLSTNIYILHIMVVALFHSVLNCFITFVPFLSKLNYVAPLIVFAMTALLAWGLEQIGGMIKSKRKSAPAR